MHYLKILGNVDAVYLLILSRLVYNLEIIIEIHSNLWRDVKVDDGWLCCLSNTIQKNRRNQSGNKSAHIMSLALMKGAY